MQRMLVFPPPVLTGSGSRVVRCTLSPMEGHPYPVAWIVRRLASSAHRDCDDRGPALLSVHDDVLFPSDELTRRLSVFTGKSLTPLALAWADSANWLWRSEELAPQLLKLARTSPEHDYFWWGLMQLFGFDRWRCPEALTGIPGALPPRLPLAPLPMTFLGRLQGAPLWSLPWREATPPMMDVTMAAQLGHQLGLIHRQSVPGWGHPAGKFESLSTWPERVEAFVASHPCRHWLSKRERWPQPSRAVWCLPDLRCDQYLIGATDWFWSDWEALVWAPIELDLCLIELLLENGVQGEAFLAAYRLHRPLPELEPYRGGMRALAVLLMLHGREATARVMDHPCWLKD